MNNLAEQFTAKRRRIYLMRHGDVRYWNNGVRVDDPDLVELTEKGHGQARNMGEFLKDVEFDKAICTGLKRTVQTAQGVLGTRDLTLNEHPALKEIRTGVTTEWTEQQLLDDFVFGMQKAAVPGARFANGEEFATFYDRIGAGLQPVLDDQSWRTLLMVCHGGTNRAVMAHLTGGGLNQFGIFEQDKCCLNILDLDMEGGKVVRAWIRLLNFHPDNVHKWDRRTSQEMILATRYDGS